MTEDMVVKVISPRSVASEDFESSDQYALAESTAVLPMIKSALLYGDKVTVISPSYSAAATYPISVVLQLLEAARRADPEAVKSSESRLMEWLEAVRRGDVGVYRKLVGAARSYARRTGAGMSESLLESPQAAEMRSAFESGLVRGALDEVMEDVSLIKAEPTIRSDRISGAWEREAPKTTDYLLSDQDTLGSLGIGGSASAQCVSTIVAAELFARLPTFDQVPMVQLLELRDDLKPYLIPFRSAVLSLTKEIQSEPFGDELRAAVDFEIRRTVEPAVLALEAGIKSNRYVAKLAEGAFGRDLAIVGGGGLCAGLASLAGLTGAIGESVAATLGAAVGGIALASKTYLEWQRETRTLEGSGLFFYFRLRQSLRRSRPD